jgi:hypothetical protein
VLKAEFQGLSLFNEEVRPAAAIWGRWR